MKTKDIPMYVLAFLIVFGYFGLLFLLTNRTVPNENNQLYNTAMGGGIIIRI
jgi:hypothetical protein